MGAFGSDYAFNAPLPRSARRIQKEAARELYRVEFNDLLPTDADDPVHDVQRPSNLAEFKGDAQLCSAMPPLVKKLH